MKKILIICFIATFETVCVEQEKFPVKAIGNSLTQQHTEKIVQKLQTFVHAIPEAPDYSFANSNLAQTLLPVGRPHLAIFQAKEALKKHELNFDALLTLGIAYRQTGQFEHAIDTLKKVIDWSHISNEHLQTNRIATACHQLAMVYSDLDKLDYAMFYYKRSLALDKTNLWATNNLAYIFYNKGQYEEAQKEFENHIQYNPYQPLASIAYAFMLRKMNDHQKYEHYLRNAAKQFEDLFEKMPTYIPTKYVKRQIRDTWSYIQNAGSNKPSRSKEVEEEILRSIIMLIQQKLPELLPDKPQEKLSPAPSKTPDSTTESPLDNPGEETDSELDDDSPYG